MPSQPALVIVTGPPCSGKSHLAEHLSIELQLPMFTKDGFKEHLFDVMGWSDRAWSQRLGRAAVELLFACAGAELRVGRSCLLECNFQPGMAVPEFERLRRAYPFTPVEVHCRAEVPVLMERFVRRWESGVRHPGHVDDLSYDEIEPALQSEIYGPLNLGGLTCIVDTTDLARVDYGAVVARVRAACEAADAVPMAPDGDEPSRR